MIYGANGFTGELIAREAVRRGYKPLLAGRDTAAIAALASSLGLAHRSFALESRSGLISYLREVDLVLHCAGPFSATAWSMIDACLETRTHYLDITGEVEVLEGTRCYAAAARRAGIVICPAVGFDVIPTDCLAVMLRRALPDATHLTLGFDSRSSLSRGTAWTAFEGLANGGRVRHAGRIIEVPIAFKVRAIDFGDGEKLAVTIPWGAVATTFHSTGIPNIETYIPCTPKGLRRLKMLQQVRPLLAYRLVQRLVRWNLQRHLKGPDAKCRGNTPTWVWGEVRNDAGEYRTGRMSTANGYDVTVSGTLLVVDQLLGEAPAPGVYTPSQLMGADFVTRLPGSSPVTIV
jgi:short subunit dehydrogenase-like uncharacterized protein